MSANRIESQQKKNHLRKDERKLSSSATENQYRQ